MLRFSANLGFLWPEHSLPNAIRRAKEAGFEAVECHFPYDVPVTDIKAALAETGFEMLSINTRLGVNGPADFGVMALPGREQEARAYIDEAIAYGAALAVRYINTPLGKSGGTPEAEASLRENLAYACSQAKRAQITILVEAINQRDAPGYHNSMVDSLIQTIGAVDADNLKLMFDCYHAQIMQGDLTELLRRSLPHIGHIQFAAVPDRGEPDQGEVDYPWLLAALERMGWTSFVGAEYRPRGATDDGLGWLKAYRQTARKEEPNP